MKQEDIPLDDELVNSSNDDSLGSDNDSLFDDNLDLGYNDFLDNNSNAPMDKHKDLLMDLTDFDPELRDKVNYWLGRVWDSDQEKYVQDPNLEPLMTEELAVWCVSFLRNYSKKTNIITHIGQKEYNEIHDDIIVILWEEFATKFAVDPITNNDLKRICVELEHAALLVLMGAGDGKYNKLLKESTQRNESVTYVDSMGQGSKPQKKLNAFDKLKNKMLGTGG